MHIVVLIISFFFKSAFASQAIHGDWIKGRKYDHRYVSSYEISTVSKPLKNFPWVEEDCHDDGDRFANWAKTISYQINYSGTISLEFLGMGLELGGQRSQMVELSFERWVHATRGVMARHALFEEYENWQGRTRIEYRYPDGTQTLGTRTYPFSVTKINYGLRVQRKIIHLCDDLRRSGD